MKKLLPLVILACSLAAFGQTYRYVKVAKANPRSRPAESASVVATVKQGTKFTILPGKTVNGWSRASFGKKTGWLRAGTYSVDPPEISTIRDIAPRNNEPFVVKTDRRNSSEDTVKEPADRIPPPEAVKPPVPKIISGGIVNGKATSLPVPPYPPAARAVKATGIVNVQVLIDEQGNVVAASAVSGHPLLRAAAVEAARQAKFSPTILNGQLVKVSGIMVYNFVP